MSISEELLRKIEKCQNCKSLIPYKKFSSHAHGNLSSKYLLISEAPANISINRKMPMFWKGPSGDLLRRCSKRCNTTLEDLFYLTDIVKCWPHIRETKNRKPSYVETVNCKELLNNEIDELNPSVILCFGKLSIDTILGNVGSIFDIHGKVFKMNSFEVIPLFHPAYFI